MYVRKSGRVGLTMRFCAFDFGKWVFGGFGGSDFGSAVGEGPEPRGAGAAVRGSDFAGGFEFVRGPPGGVAAGVGFCCADGFEVVERPGAVRELAQDDLFGGCSFGAAGDVAAGEELVDALAGFA